jgi:hypothetical protein
MTCEDEKDIDQMLQHLRECDKCFFELKAKIAEFLKTTQGMLLKTIITKFIRKDA